MSFELIKPFKEARTLVRFQFGPSTIHATTWKTDLTFDGDVYYSEPGIEIKMPVQSGGLNEDFMVMELSRNRSKVHTGLHTMVTQLASPRAVPKLEVEIFQHIVDGDQQRTVYLYEGTLERSRVNPEGRAGILALEFATELRSGLDRVTLGRRCDPECDAVFGGSGCGHPNGFGIGQFDASTFFPNQYRATRSAWVTCDFDPTNPRKVFLYSLSPTVYPTATQSELENTWSAQPPGWWIGSFLKKGGVTIPIQAWQQSQPWVVLNRLPPKTWDGSTVFLQLDCPRSAAQCNLRNWQNRFNGMGYGIPAYNPALDLPNNA